MKSDLPPGVLIIREILVGEINRLTPKASNPTPRTNGDCSFVCYVNDGRADLKNCGTMIRMVSVMPGFRQSANVGSSALRIIIIFFRAGVSKTIVNRSASWIVLSSWVLWCSMRGKTNTHGASPTVRRRPSDPASLSSLFHLPMMPMPT